MRQEPRVGLQHGLHAQLARPLHQELAQLGLAADDVGMHGAALALQVAHVPPGGVHGAGNEVLNLLRRAAQPGEKILPHGLQPGGHQHVAVAAQRQQIQLTLPAGAVPVRAAVAEGAVVERKILLWGGGSTTGSCGSTRRAAVALSPLRERCTPPSSSDSTHRRAGIRDGWARSRAGGRHASPARRACPRCGTPPFPPIAG